MLKMRKDPRHLKRRNRSKPGALYYFINTNKPQPSYCDMCTLPDCVNGGGAHVNQDVVEDSAHSTKLTIVNKNQCE